MLPTAHSKLLLLPRTRAGARLGLVCGCLGDAIFQPSAGISLSIAPLLLTIGIVKQRWLPTMVAAVLAAPTMAEPTTAIIHTMAVAITFAMVHGLALTLTFGEAWVLAQGMPTGKQLVGA